MKAFLYAFLLNISKGIFKGSSLLQFISFENRGGKMFEKKIRIRHKIFIREHLD